MATVVAAYQQGAFVNPQDGQFATGATVLGNDNALRATYNGHDGEPGVHLQSSIAASKPAAAVAGRKWMESDTLKIWYDTGSVWSEIAYIPIAGGTMTGGLVINAGGLVVTGNSVIAGTLGGLLGLAVVSGATTMGGTLAVTGATTLSSTLGVTGSTTLNAITTISAGGLTITAGGITISAGGGAITGNVNIAGAVTGVTGLTVVSGGISVTGNSSITGTLATLAFTATGNITTTGNISLTTAVGKIIPGATSLSHRNTADSADNLLITDAGNVTVRGLLTIPAGTVSSASANVPQGVAPTSPNNGDVWVTSAGMFLRASGSTIGPFGSGSASVSGTTGQVPKFTSASAVGNGIMADNGSSITIATGAANAQTLIGSGYSLTGASTVAMIDLTGTWNTSGTPTAIKINITDTASAALSLFFDGQIGGVSKFAFGKDGSLRLAGVTVVGNRRTGWTPWTGTANRTSFDTATATLVNVAQALKALLDDIHSTAGHGLIGT